MAYTPPPTLHFFLKQQQQQIRLEIRENERDGQSCAARLKTNCKFLVCLGWPRKLTSFCSVESKHTCDKSIRGLAFGSCVGPECQVITLERTAACGRFTFADNWQTRHIFIKLSWFRLKKSVYQQIEGIENLSQSKQLCLPKTNS